MALAEIYPRARQEAADETGLQVEAVQRELLHCLNHLEEAA